MLNENLKAIRLSKGLSQQELAVKLNVVRQTISKWEKGLSVPDADMLIALSEAFDTPVSILLGETVTEAKADSLKAISEKLEVINLQLAQRKIRIHKVFHLLSLRSSWAVLISAGITPIQKKLLLVSYSISLNGFSCDWLQSFSPDRSLEFS